MSEVSKQEKEDLFSEENGEDDEEEEEEENDTGEVAPSRLPIGKEATCHVHS